MSRVISDSDVINADRLLSVIKKKKDDMPEMAYVKIGDIEVSFVHTQKTEKVEFPSRGEFEGFSIEESRS